MLLDILVRHLNPYQAGSNGKSSYDKYGVEDIYSVDYILLGIGTLLSTILGHRWVLWLLLFYVNWLCEGLVGRYHVGVIIEILELDIVALEKSVYLLT